MGEIRKINCRNCDKTWEYRSGCGMMHARLGSVADLFEPDIAAQFMIYADKKPPVIFDFSFMPAKCEQCKDIVEIPVLNILEARYEGKCVSCNSDVKIITDLNKFNCPQCFSKELEQSVIGYWD